MTSVAAGMYNLTAVQSAHKFEATVSSGQDSLAELMKLDIAEGESICLRPKHLVGVVQKTATPLRISSHWYVGTIQAWLSLQVRYLVFHGPASIIIKGCRGIRIRAAEDGTAIEQVSMIGFSANLAYATSRTETFFAYLGGNKGLLRDRFSGTKGYVIYEEMPDPSKRSGLNGKGIEGVADAVLKVLGI